MGSIQNRGQGRWRARYRGTDGRELSKTFKRKADAELFIANVESSKARGDWLDPARSSLTVAAWLETWLPSRRMDLRITSYERLRGIVQHHLVPRFGHRKLASLGNQEIRAWVADLQESGQSAASTRKALFALRSALEAAVSDRRLTTNPANNVPLPSERAPEQRFLTRDEVDRLADAMDPQYRVVVLLGAMCGLRWGEIAGLRRSRIDVLRSRLTVDQTAVEAPGHKVSFGDPKTRGSRRTIPVARSIMAQIEQHMNTYVGAEPDALLVTAPEGGACYRGTFRRNAWVPAATTAGLQGLRVHDLRHTFVSLLIAAGADIKQVSTWAGHSSVVVTLDVYAHLMRDGGDTIADEMDRYLASTTPVAAPVLELKEHA